MPCLSIDRLNQYRTKTYRIDPELRLSSENQALQFVNERGFIFFWPDKGFVFPSLWTAVAGDRPVADAHDDPGHITWNWKDQALGKKKWYYARLLRRRNAFVSLEVLPLFYALSPNYGDPEQDYLEDYKEGRMPLESRKVYEALLYHGALDSFEIRRLAGLSAEQTRNRYTKALDELQTSMRILPVGISQSGPWRYAFIYDLVTRHFPDLIARSRSITDHQAYETLAKIYFITQGAASAESLRILFRWNSDICHATVASLHHQGILIDCVQLSSREHDWFAIPGTFA